LTATADAQLTAACLRPLAISDKWIENRTPPLDGTDLFRYFGPSPTPDVYIRTMVTIEIMA